MSDSTQYAERRFSSDHCSTAESARGADNAPSGRAIPPRVRAIIRSAALEHGVTPADILGDSRSRKITRARWEAMEACRELVMPGGDNPSFPQIGRWFGRDHSTVMYGLRKIGPAQQELFAA